MPVITSFWAIRNSRRGANLVDREVDAALEIDKGIGSPDVLMNLIPRDDLPRSLGKRELGDLVRISRDHGECQQIRSCTWKCSAIFCLSERRSSGHTSENLRAEANDQPRPDQERQTIGQPGKVPVSDFPPRHTASEHAR